MAGVSPDVVTAFDDDGVGEHRAPAVEALLQQCASLTPLAFVSVGVVVLLALAAGLTSWSAPDAALGRDAGWFAAVAVFITSYIAVAIGRIPGLALDRAGVALVGAALMVASGALPLDEAYRSIDLDTLTLLLGMMIVVAHLRLSGFFPAAAGWVLRRTHHPLALLGIVTAVAGTFSAFLVNDAICLALTPLVIDLAQSARRNPVPYLLAVAMASNIGSTATITGNPQNMIVGALSGIGYANFAATLAPVAVIGLLLTVLMIVLFHRSEFRANAGFVVDAPTDRPDRALMVRALVGIAALIIALFVGQPPAKAAIIIGALLLLTRRVDNQRIYSAIDWPLLLMFAGLFIIVAGAEHTLLTPEFTARVALLHLDSVPALSATTAVLSNLVSNVPAVLVLKPFIPTLRDQHTGWITVAMASTLAGNFTVIGSIANLIVVQGAAARDVRIGFWDYFKVGAPLTLLTLTIGTCWLWL
jgi:Na+/H+ antiporter NhaD/arsenite permease-like protein